MEVKCRIAELVIPNTYMVAADPIQKRGFVILNLTNDQGDRFSLEIAKGVALAVKDEIRRVTGSR